MSDAPHTDSGSDGEEAGPPERRRRRYPGISSRAWEHPADRSALVSLRKLTGFDTVFKVLSGMLPERSIRLLFLSDSVRVNEEQFSHLHRMLLDACEILDLERVPPMYVTQDPQPNAMCVGMDQPIIVVTTGLVELLDEEEMRAVVGHEVGHALSGHAVYRTMLLFLTSIAVRVAWIPLGNIAIMGIVTALREWFRKAELSADRAGLLAGQDLDASLRGLMKLAGGNHLHHMNVDSFLRQAEEYEAGGDVRDSVLKILSVLPRTHPFAAVRAAELKKWSETRDYQRLRDGHYPRRDEDGNARITDAVRESASSYASSVRQSKDPLMKLVHDVAGGAGELGSKLRDFARGGGNSDRGGQAGTGSGSDSHRGGQAGSGGDAAGQRDRGDGAGPGDGGAANSGDDGTGSTSEGPDLDKS